MIEAGERSEQPEDDGRPALLVVLDKDPLPATSGSRQRAVNLIRALTSCGDVDVYLLGVPAEPPRCSELEHELRVRRVVTTGRLPEARRSLAHLDSPALPSAIASIDAVEAQKRFDAAMTADYDLVLYVGLPAWWALHPGVHARISVIDTENVMSVWASRMARTELAGARAHDPLRHRVRAIERAGRQLLDVRRWRRLEALAAERADAIVVCSRHDLTALGVANAVVVPNGVEPPAEPVGTDQVGPAPTLVFPAKLTYPPNVDGARFLVHEVLPELLQAQPDARVILAGKAPDSVRALASGRVEVTGYVDHIEDVLARADAVVVPLRAGGGTRIKILEAWAHRIPVVSTTIGAEGLDAEDGVDLLLADTPREIALACRRVLTDDALRQALTARGRQRVETQFDWATVRRQAAMIFDHLLR